MWLAVTLFLAGPSAGQEASGSATFEGTTEVLEIEIPVNVTTRDGQPIRDLGPESFEVFDEGVRQEITGLSQVDLALLGTEGGRRRLESELPAAARRRLLLLFDVSFSDPISIAKAREAARRFVLESLHPTDLVAVMVHSLESGAQLLVTFTPDRAQVVRAVETLGLRDFLNPGEVRDPLRFIIDPALDPELRSSTGNQGSDSFNQALIDHLSLVGERMALAERAYARNKITSWSRSLGQMAEHLGSVKGRKHVVLFSEGFDGRLLLGHQPSADDPTVARNQQLVENGELWRVDTDQTYGNTVLKRHILEMIEQFRRADCVIQAVDIAGLTAGGTRAERDRNVGQDALFFIANETGGHLFENANDLADQLRRVLRHSEVTYLLSFQPSAARLEGRYHRLKVKGPKGVRLSYRAGYTEPREYQELHPLEKSLLAGDAIASARPRDDIGLEVIAVPFRGAPTVAYVPVVIEIDGPSLLAGTRGDTLPMEIYAYPTDEKGRIPTYFHRLLDVDLARGGEVLRRNGMKYYGHLVLETGEYLVRILVRNSETGAAGVTAVPVSVPRFDEEKAFLPPLFMESPGDWLMVREESDATDGASTVYPFTVNGEPFVPAAKPSLRRREEARLCLVAYGMEGDELHLASRVTSNEGDEVAGGRVTMVERTVTGVRRVDKLIAKFRPQGLSAGEYRLELALTGGSNGEARLSSIPFAVE